MSDHDYLFTTPPRPDAPVYWRHQPPGNLARVINGLLDDPMAELPESDLQLMRDYVSQWLASPVWETNPYGGENWDKALPLLRELAPLVRDTGELCRLLMTLLTLGINPIT